MFKLKWRYMAPDDDAGGAGGDDDAGGTDGEQSTDDKATILDSRPGNDDKGGQDDKAGEGDGWSWFEDIPGTGEVPPWFKADKYKTVADQARATPELEAKLGPAAEMLGAPEENYELPPLPEGITGEWDAEDPMLSKFMEVAKNADLSQKAFNDIAGPMAELLATETAENEAAIADALSKLGTNSAQRIEQVGQYLTAELGEDLYNELNDAIGTNVQAYLGLEALVARASGDAQLSSLPGKRGPGFTKEDIQAAQYKVFPEGHNLAGEVMYDHDAEHRLKVDNMWKQLFPGDDVQQVG